MNIQMELTNQCNLSCIECPHRFMQRKKEFMSKGVFFKILSDYISPLRDDSAITKYPSTIIVHKDGEPLLHPDFRYFLRRISDARPDTKIDIYTNGLKFTEELFDFLCTLNNKIWVLVSFHFFNANGIRNDYAKASQELLRALRKGSDNVEFVFVSHITSLCAENELEFWAKNWVDFVHDYEIKNLRDVAIGRCINPWTGLIKGEDNLAQFDVCPYMDGNHLFVGVTGNVVPCCMDLDEEVIFGNVMENEKNEIMENADKFYGEHRDKEINYDICKRCLKR